MREGVRRMRRRRWEEGMRGEPGERLERQQNEGESKKRAAAIEFQREDMVEWHRIRDERNGVNICARFFPPTPCSSISPD